MSKVDNQKKLLAEIDDICKKNHLQYSLIGECVRNLELTGNPQNHLGKVEIAMVEGEMKTLYEAIRVGKDSRRSVEYIKSIPFSTFVYMAYGMMGTSSINLLGPNIKTLNRHNVIIMPIQRQYTEKTKKYAHWNAIIKRMIVQINKPTKKISGKNIIEKWEEIKSENTVYVKGQAIRSRYLNKPDIITIDGSEINVPSNYQDYLRESFGDNKDQSILIKNPKYYIEDEIVDCVEVVDALQFQIKRLRFLHRMKKAVRALAVPSRKKIRKLREIVKLVIQHESIELYFEKQKKAIQASFEKKDITELKALTMPIVKYNKKCKKYNIPYLVGNDVLESMENLLK